MDESPYFAASRRMNDGPRPKDSVLREPAPGPGKCDGIRDLPSPFPRLLSVEQIAKYLGTSSRTIRRWIDDKQLPVHRLGRLIRISETDLIAFLQSRRS